MKLPCAQLFSEPITTIHSFAYPFSGTSMQAANGEGTVPHEKAAFVLNQQNDVEMLRQ